MSEVPPKTPAFRATGLLLGVALGLAGHVVAVGAAFLAARTVPPSSGGFEDLAAALTVFLAAEVAVALACLIYGLTMVLTGVRDRGAGVLVGWAVGAIAVMAYLFGPG